MPSSQTKKTTKKSPTKKTHNTPTADRAIPTAPEDPTAKYAADAWVSGGIGGMEDVRVPSGQLCLVRRPGLQGLMQAGVLRNIDSLSALVSDKHLKKTAKGKKSDQVNVESIMKDTKALNDILHTVDKVVCHCVVKPEVHPTPNDVTTRKPGVVYADMIDINDKMYLFNFVVGGTRDLETFRSGLGEHVGSLEDGEGVPQEAE